jgi:M6 family metalloprotease-like protein
MRSARPFFPSILLGMLVAAGVLVPAASAVAAQYQGDARQFRQPDGALVEVRLYGTEFYMRAESPDGYTLVRDPGTGFICYAEPAADGSLASTGKVYRGAAGADTPRWLTQRGLDKGVRPSSAKVASIVQATRRALMPGAGTGSDAQTALAEVAFSKYKPTLGSGKGLVVLVDFSDRPQSIPASEYEKAFNGDTYDSLGSIRTWIESISYAQYTASHTVVGPLRADYPTSHYVGGVEFDYSASRELMKQVYAYIDDNVDLTSYATNGSMPSLVVIYPGAEVAAVWATGLWPHAGEGGYRTSEGVRIPNAFISNGGTRTPMSLKTFRHELGHSLFTWPDTYDYDDDSMSAGGYATETTLPCAPFRMWSGWLTVIDLVGVNQTYSLAANGDTCLRYENASNSSEYFVVEYMKKDSVYRNDTPDEGLLIWHVDEKGDNSLQDMTPTKHYELSVEQADGLFDLEKNKSSRANDLFHAGNKDKFDDTTTPESKWWNGTASGFAVCNVGALDPTISVTVGCSGDIGTGGAGGTGGATGGTTGTGGTTSAGGAGGTGNVGDAGPDGARRDGAADLREVPGAGGAGGTTGPADGPLATGGRGGGSGGATSTGGATSAAGGASGSGGTTATGGSGGGSGGTAGSGGTGGNGTSSWGGASGGTTGTGGSSPAGGTTGTGGSTTGAGGSSAGGSRGSGASAENAGQGTTGLGCSCVVGAAGSRPSPGLLALLVLGVAVLGRRLRRPPR